MDFYGQIRKYYDIIFPLDREMLEMIARSAGSQGASIVDLACGTGTYALELANLGHKVTATDIEQAMVEEAKSKARLKGLELNLFAMDMRNLITTLGENCSPDLVFCVGNSLVHLESTGEIQNVLKQMWQVLKPGGRILLQIINYDRVIEKGISQLPTLHDSDTGVEFIRKYELDHNTGRIGFHTILTVERESLRLENTILLYPLLKEQLEEILQLCGFRNIEWFGSFDGTPYTNESYLTIARATKSE